MSLPAIEYERIPKEEAPGHCYTCFPPHPAEWRSGKTGALRLCGKVLDRLVAEGKATRVEESQS